MIASFATWEPEGVQPYPNTGKEVAVAWPTVSSQLNQSGRPRYSIRGQPKRLRATYDA